jgi:hypothetical protein
MNNILTEDTLWKQNIQNKCNNVLNTFSKYDTLDTLVNGIHLVFTFSPLTFSYGEVWEQLSNIIDFYYEAAAVSGKATRTTARMPSNTDLEDTFIGGYSFMVFSIAPNQSGEKYHCHCYIYGIHNYSGTWVEWKNKFDRKMRSLKCVSSSGSPIYYEPVKDPIDTLIRKNESNNYYTPLVKYVTERKEPSLMNYFHSRNNKNFIYHYLV